MKVKGCWRIVVCSVNTGTLLNSNGHHAVHTTPERRNHSPGSQNTFPSIWTWSLLIVRSRPAWRQLSLMLIITPWASEPTPSSSCLSSRTVIAYGLMMVWPRKARASFLSVIKGIPHTPYTMVTKSRSWFNEQIRSVTNDLKSVLFLRLLWWYPQNPSLLLKFTFILSNDHVHLVIHSSLVFCLPSSLSLSLLSSLLLI